MKTRDQFQSGLCEMETVLLMLFLLAPQRGAWGCHTSTSLFHYFFDSPIQSIISFHLLLTRAPPCHAQVIFPRAGSN